jgi:hypothetical protein
MHDALSAVQVLHPQITEFFMPETVIEQGSQDGPISDALERVRGWRFQQFAGLRDAVLPSFPLTIGRFTPSTGFAGDSVAFAEIIEERGQRRELAPECWPAPDGIFPCPCARK